MIFTYGKEKYYIYIHIIHLYVFWFLTNIKLINKNSLLKTQKNKTRIILNIIQIAFLLIRNKDVKIKYTIHSDI